jgi:hypothetical protein
MRHEAYITRQGYLQIGTLMPREVKSIEEILLKYDKNLKFDNEPISGSYYQYFTALTKDYSKSQIQELVKVLNSKWRGEQTFYLS